MSQSNEAAKVTTSWIECGKCLKPTRHAHLKEESISDYAEEHDVNYGVDFRIVRCMGCETTSFQKVSWNDSQCHPETGEPSSHETLYPGRTPGRSRIQVASLPPKVDLVYDDTVRAFNVGARLLAAAGLRAVVEAVCLDQGCTGNLKAKIDGLVAKGAIAAKQAEFLHLHRLIGNEAVHEITSPPAEELIAALDIVESVLRNIYELPQIAAGLKEARDRRNAK